MTVSRSLPDQLSDSDVERIKARIRGERFALIDFRKMTRWMALFGAACGAIGCPWIFIAQLFQTGGSFAGGPPSIWSIVTSALEGMLIGSVVGALVGLGVVLLLKSLFSFFRPVYVALVYSPQEFEREYGDKPPKGG